MLLRVLLCLVVDYLMIFTFIVYCCVALICRLDLLGLVLQLLLWGVLVLFRWRFLVYFSVYVC